MKPSRIRRLARAPAAALLILLCASSPADAQGGSRQPFPYLSPLPGSARNLPETNVILRPAGTVETPLPASASTLLRATGSISGPHEGILRLSDDRRTLTFDPALPFAPGEEVTCRLVPGLRTEEGRDIGQVEFAFTIAGPEREALREFRMPPEDGGDVPAEIPTDPPPAPSTDPLPPDFPAIHVTISGPPSPGRLFLSNIDLRRPDAPGYLMILENDGTPYFHRRLLRTGLDFKMQPDGRLTYFDSAARAFFAMDAQYAVADSFRTGNGYATDPHELILLPNGHALLMAYDPQVVDMSGLVKGGWPDAIVIGLVIQELDREKRVVFQWRSWDHFQITDAVSHNLAARVVDYVHGNSIDVDRDGHLILSSRHMNEVTKISRETGEIIWRLGGRNNQFTFINETLPFSHQHDARRLPNGNLTLFDNGTFRLPRLSRAVEYGLDEERRTATLVWEHHHMPDVFGAALGNVQRLPGGSTLVCWGSTTPTLTEVAPDGSTVLELSFDPGVSTYRAFRFEWPPARPAEVTVLPQILQTGSRGTRVMATIAPDAGSFDLSTVEPASVRLAGSLPPAPDSVTWTDRNGDGLPDLMLRFEREALLRLLTPRTTRIEVSGSLTSGEAFRGYAEVRVVVADGPPTDGETSMAGAAPAEGGPGANDGTAAAGGAAALRVVSPPGGLPVELLLGPSGASPRGRLLAIYDIQGRIVKRWRPPAGRDGRVAWDGRRADGRRVAAGLYFARAEGAGARGEAVKLVVTR